MIIEDSMIEYLFLDHYSILISDHIISGLGKQIASELFRMGATVIIASRNAAKCEVTIQDIKSKHPDSLGKLEIGVLDTSDLDSVKIFANSFLKNHSKLHALINNAGIHYISTEGNPLKNLNLPMKSKQGYDLAFATNYLGHFLLSELMIPILEKTSSFGTIINTASSYHFLANSSMLETPEKNVKKNTKGQDSMPSAARSDINDSSHRKFAYANNKLAQVLHAKELQRRLNGQNLNVRTAAVCPGWVDTGILPNDIGGRIVAKLAFKVEEGILSTMHALFSSNLQGGEFIGNSLNYWGSSKTLMIYSKKLGVTGPVGDFLAMWLLIFQKMTYGEMYVGPSSLESLDEELSKTLYDWSKAEVSSYLK
jgi:NAD(P)-dependent dehydrogenase (short-subunit alcohol dehydrogenase family)